MSFKTATSVVLLGISILLGQSAYGQLLPFATVNFDDVPAGVIPNGAVFNSGGVEIHVINGGFAGGVGVDIGPPSPFFTTASLPHVATPNNVGMEFQMATIPGDIQVITFNYLNQGGDVTLLVNGRAFGPIANFPNGNFGGIRITNGFSTVPGGILGRVSIEAPTGIFEFGVGGQETQFDNFRFLGEGILGDVNCDGVVNLLDVGPFIDLLNNQQYSPKADMDMDGEVTLLDIDPFVDAIQGGP